MPDNSDLFTKRFGHASWVYKNMVIIFGGMTQIGSISESSISVLKFGEHRNEPPFQDLSENKGSKPLDTLDQGEEMKEDAGNQDKEMLRQKIGLKTKKNIKEKTPNKEFENLDDSTKMLFLPNKNPQSTELPDSDKQPIKYSFTITPI